MRIKLFVLRNKEADEDGAFNLPDGWWPISVESSDMGCIYVWAREQESEDRVRELEADIAQCRDEYDGNHGG